MFLWIIMSQRFADLSFFNSYNFNKHNIELSKILIVQFRERICHPTILCTQCLSLYRLYTCKRVNEVFIFSLALQHNHNNQDQSLFFLSPMMDQGFSTKHCKNISTMKATWSGPLVSKWKKSKALQWVVYIVIHDFLTKYVCSISLISYLTSHFYEYVIIFLVSRKDKHS